MKRIIKLNAMGKIEYNAKNAKFNYIQGNAELTGGDYVVICEMEMYDFFDFFNYCSENFPILTERISGEERDKLYHPTITDIDNYLIKFKELKQHKKNELQLGENREEEKAAELQLVKKIKKKKPIKPIKRIVVGPGEVFEVIITNNINIGKNKIKNLEATQKISIDITGIKIPERRTSMCTYETIIHKHGDAS